MSFEVEFGTQTFENKRQSSEQLAEIAKEIRRDIIKKIGRASCRERVSLTV